MFDFPNAPTNGQLVTGPTGQVFQWDGTKWVTLATQPPPSAGNVGRNLLHNAMFNVWQRGTGPFNTAGYTADRWPGQKGKDYAYAIGQLNAAWDTFWTTAKAYVEQLDNGVRNP
jgi:hypothetical protein